jgi:hypothetical protein
MPRRSWILVPFAVAAACAMRAEPPPPTAPQSSSPAGYDDRDCNLHTPLQPGTRAARAT